MKELGLFCVVRAKKYRSYKGDVGKIAPNLLNRDFTAKQPNEKWAIDITEFSLLGKNYTYQQFLTCITARSSATPSVIARACRWLWICSLNQSVKRLPQQHALILHSDQGWHYQMKAYQRVLEANDIQQSMSRKGNCLDNAVQENFFGILKSELPYIQQFDSIEHFIQELHDYMHWHNHRRTEEKLKGMSPVEYRVHSFDVA